MLEFKLLGPLEVRGDDGLIPISGQRQRALLALLLLRANQLVPKETLIDLLWGERPPPSAGAALQNAVALLRKTLGPGLLLWESPGYRFSIDTSQLDLARFVELTRLAAGADAPVRARYLKEALDLWHGPALEDLALESWATEESNRLDKLRFAASERLIDARLELGQHEDVIDDLEGLIRADPHREAPYRLLMLALYRSGRQAEALDAYNAARAVLNELGLPPSPELTALRDSMLRQEPSLLPARPTLADHYGEVMRALVSGRLVPVLGMGDDPELGQNGLATRLGARFECPPEHLRGLAYVSQYVAARNGLGPLWDELHEALDQDFEPGALHTWLAGMAPMLRARGLPHQLIVTSAFDTRVQRAFADAGEELDVVTYLAGGRDRGRFLHVAPDGRAVVIGEPNAYVGLSLDTRTVLLKIHGQVDRTDDRVHESFAVREDDHIDYLTGIEAPGTVPVTLAARLRRSHLLFVGYPVHDWSLRVFLRRVWGHDRLAYRSWAVHSAAESVDRDLWGERGVEVYEVDLGDYAENLARHTYELDAVEAKA